MPPWQFYGGADDYLPPLAAALGYSAVQRLAYNTAQRKKTQTQTMTKRQRTTHEVQAAYGEIANYYETARPWPRIQYKLLKDLPKLFAVNTNTAVNTTSGTGAQGVNDVHTFFSNTDLQGIMSNVNAAVPNAYLAGTAGTPALAGTPSNTTDMFLEKLTAEMMFTNSTQGTAMRLYIAYCKPRRDLDAAWSPKSAWTTGLTDSGSTGSVAAVGNNPFMVSAFTDNWKISRLHSTILTPGATVIEKIHLKRRRKINNETLRAMASGSTIYLKNWTVAVMVWFHGLPVEDNASTTTTSGNVKLMVFNKECYSYSFVMNNRNNTVVVSGLAGSQAATVANEITGTTASGAPV